MKKFLPLLLILTMLFSGCAADTSSDSSNTEASQSSSELSQNDSELSQSDSELSQNDWDPSQSDSDLFTNRDYRVEYDESSSVLIQLDGSSASASSNSVQISDRIIRITEEATYIISGTLDDGMIIVDADDSAKIQLVLNGVEINSETSAPLYILEADKVFVTLAENTSNTLSNGGTFTAIDDNNIDAAIFSKQDLTFNGSGSLTVISPADHGIVCKDDLVFTSGTYIINSASHGLDANDSIRITNAEITIAAGKDGIHAENDDDSSLGFIYISSGTLTIDAEGDGISAGAYMQIAGGTFQITSGGGSENASQQTSNSWGGFMGGKGDKQSQTFSDSSDLSSSSDSTSTADDSTSIKGLKAADSILISDGTFTINSADDSVHSNASITINGGTFEIAAGDDAFHADDTLTITDGTIHITESYEGLEGLHVNISGGSISLTASDDGLNAAGGTDSSGFGGQRGKDQFGGGSSSTGTITISGGNLYIEASGDGIDANGSLTISGGYTVVCGPSQGDTSTLDYDNTAVITGGTFIGTGGSSMAQSFSDHEQGVIAVKAGSQSAQTAITLTDSNGNTVISYEPTLSFSVIILSSPDIIIGETYTITIGSSSMEYTVQ